MVLLENFKKFGKDKYKITVHHSQIHHRGKHQKFWEILLSFFPEDSYFINNGTQIVFSAENIESLETLVKDNKYISYKQTFLFFKQVGEQLQVLEKNNITIPFFSISDFVVIDSKFFIYINVDKLFPIGDNNHILIDTPYDISTPFFAPELKNIKKLPQEIYFTSGIFSLAYLSIYLLTNQHLTPEIIKKGQYWNQISYKNCIDCTNTKKTEGICSEILLLGSIFDTKLYWALKRCLELNPRKRFFIII